MTLTVHPKVVGFGIKDLHMNNHNFRYGGSVSGVKVSQNKYMEN